MKIFWMGNIHEELTGINRYGAGEGFIICCIMLAGIVLRLWSIDYGVPFLSHPDELHYLPKAAAMLATLNLNPHYFHNPPFLTYIYTFSLALWSFVLWVARVFVDVPTLMDLIVKDVTPFVVMARGISALLGAGTCFIIYGIGKKLFSPNVGLVSAALLSFCFLHVRNSHYAVNDVAAVFFMMVAFKYIVEIWERGALASYIKAGIVVGIAIATKYNMGIIIVAFIVAHCIRQNGPKDERWKAFFAFFVFCGIGFFAACPWIVLDMKAFFKGFLSQMLMAQTPWFGGSRESPYAQFLKTLLWGYGWIPSLFTLAGGFFLLKKKRIVALLCIFPCVYFLLIGSSNLFFVRFVLPVIPFLCILAAVGIVAVSGCFMRPGKKNACVFFLTVIALLQCGIFSVRYNFLIGKPDTRVTARDWMRNNIEAGSKIAAEGLNWNINDLPADAYKLYYEVLPLKYYYLLELPLLGKNTPMEEFTSPGKSVDDFRKEGFRFIVTQDFMRKAHTADPAKYREYYDYYERIETETEQIYASCSCDQDIPYYLDESYTPFWNIFILDNPGPCVRIYEIPL